VLPCASVALQITVVVVTGNGDPDPGLHDGVIAPSTMSVAVAENETAAPPAPVACTPPMFEGTDTTGGVVSVTVTVNDAEPGLLWASVALQVTVVVPTGNVDPDAAEHVGVSDPSTASTALAAPNDAVAPPGLVASTLTFPGTLTTGPVVSWTVIVNEVDAGPVVVSVASQVTVVTPIGNVPDVWSQVTGPTSFAGSEAVTVKL
jgi:hypothetical protein